MIKELKDFKNVTAEDFITCWEQYLQTKEWRYDRCFLFDLIYNYNCKDIDHLKATDYIRNKTNFLFEELEKADKIDDWEEADKIDTKITDMIDFFFKNDYKLMKILVDELVGKNRYNIK